MHYGLRSTTHPTNSARKWLSSLNIPCYFISTLAVKLAARHSQTFSQSHVSWPWPGPKRRHSAKFRTSASGAPTRFVPRLFTMIPTTWLFRTRRVSVSVILGQQALYLAVCQGHTTQPLKASHHYHILHVDKISCDHFSILDSSDVLIQCHGSFLCSTLAAGSMIWCIWLSITARTLRHLSAKPSTLQGRVVQLPGTSRDVVHPLVQI